MRTSKSTGFSSIKRWYHEKRLLTVVKSLKRREFSANYFPSVVHLNRYLLKMIPKSATVGIPGSVTIRELRIIDKLRKRGNAVIHHWKKGLTEKKSRNIRLKEASADYYITSTNAITTEGDIINIDGIGNRVAAMIYGPRNVFIIAGRNKVVPSIEAGIKRSKSIAAVMNAKRIGAKTPCAQTGICIDCNARRRICRVISIMQYRPWHTNIAVMLVNEDLGF